MLLRVQYTIAFWKHDFLLVRYEEMCKIVYAYAFSHELLDHVGA